MGKYYTFKHDYDTIPNSKNNFIKALKRIGQRDPEKIEKTKLCGRKPKPGEKLKDKEYIGRGILNVRKKLNRHLGKSGKYTNRMIRLCAEIELVKTENNLSWLKAKLPYKDYKKIVSATYNILRECDKKYCTELLSCEREDKYIQKDFYKNQKYKTVAPIQTNMIIRTSEGKTEKITEFAEDFRKDILEVK